MNCSNFHNFKFALTSLREGCGMFHTMKKVKISLSILEAIMLRVNNKGRVGRIYGNTT